MTDPSADADDQDDAGVQQQVTVDDLFRGLGSSNHDGQLTPPEVEEVLKEVHPVVAGEFVRRWASARDSVGSSAEHPDFRRKVGKVLDDYPDGYGGGR